MVGPGGRWIPQTSVHSSGECTRDFYSELSISCKFKPYFMPWRLNKKAEAAAAAAAKAQEKKEKWNNKEKKRRRSREERKEGGEEMVKSYLRYEPGRVFGVVCSVDSNICYDSSGKQLLAPALESVGVWNVRQGICSKTLSPSSSSSSSSSRAHYLAVTSIASSPSSLVNLKLTAPLFISIYLTLYWVFFLS